MSSFSNALTASGPTPQIDIAVQGLDDGGTIERIQPQRSSQVPRHLSISTQGHEERGTG